MKIYAIFGQRTCDYPDEYAPELLEAWDEYAVEENPQGWDEKLDHWLSQQGPGKPFDKVEVFHLDVDEEIIYKVLRSTPVVGARVTKASDS